MLGDDEAGGAEKWGGAEEAEDAVVLIFFRVGRIEKYEIEWGVGRFVLARDFLEGAEGVDREDMGSGGDCERFEIATNQDSSGGVILDEDDFDGAATKSFDPDGAGAGENVEETRAGDVGAEDVEEGFAQAIAGGAEGIALEAF